MRGKSQNDKRYYSDAALADHHAYWDGVARTANRIAKNYEDGERYIRGEIKYRTMVDNAKRRRVAEEKAAEKLKYKGK